MESPPVPGLKFEPTDEDIVRYYFPRYLNGCGNIMNYMTRLKFCNYDPWELPKFSKFISLDQKWFFLSLLERKQGSGNCRRTTISGRWKVTAPPKEFSIDVGDPDIDIVRRNILTFYEGPNQASFRTNWTAHEFSLKSGRVDHAIYKLIHKGEQGDAARRGYQLTADDREFVHEQPFVYRQAAASLYDEVM